MSDFVTALDCSLLVGWGATWGGSWGGEQSFDIGGALPTYAPFDLFCFCGEAVQYIPSFLGVTASTDPSEGFVDSMTGGYTFVSDDGDDNGLFVDISLPTSQTLDLVVRLDSVPPDFQTGTRRIFVGTYDDTLFCMGLFVSQLGLAFGGAPDDAPLYLADSSSLVQEGEVYALRLVLQPEQEVVYIYWSTLAEAQTLGMPVLRYRLPLLASADVPSHQEGVYVSVQGTASNPSQITILSLCVSSSALVPNVPPVADAGPDQRVALCSVIRLDGSRSYDPEGGALTYLWTVVDVPQGSRVLSEGEDGETLADLSGFVLKLYSIHAVSSGADSFPFSPGDILLHQGVSHTLVGRGTDGNGDYFEVSSASLPASLSGQTFKIVRQDDFVSSDHQFAQYIPDKAGLYRFQLVVSDGNLTSDVAETLASVRAINEPRGVVPQTEYLWDYLSDVTRLTEDPERIQLLYSSILQILGAELLHAWQVDYGKSLKSIPRTIARRWLNYDLLLREPFGYLTSLRYVGKGVQSSALSGSGLALGGSKLILSIPYREDLVEVTLTSSETSPLLVAAFIEKALQKVHKGFKVGTLRAAGASRSLSIMAPFPFTVVAGSWAAWTVGEGNTPLEGASAVRISTDVLEVEGDLRGLPLLDGDLVALKTATGVELVRFGALLPPAAEPPSVTRMRMRDPVPYSLEGSWVFCLQAISPQLDFWGGLVHAADPCILETTDTATSTPIFTSIPVIGVNESRKNVLALYPDSAVLPYLGDPARFTTSFWGVYRQRALPVEAVVERIPFLQALFEATEGEVLRENLDYKLTTLRGQRAVEFETDVWVGTPVARLWAEYTYLSNEQAIEDNFGEAVGLGREQLAAAASNLDYLSAVRGLWFAYFRGPRVANLRIGAQVLLGLPFAEERGTIIEIDSNFSPKLGRILVEDAKEPKAVRSYSFAKVLPVETNPSTQQTYAVGDVVEQFAPLVRGVEVVDYVSDPSWIIPFLNQGLLQETDRFHHFLVRIGLEAFSLPSTLFIQDFLRRIRPLRVKPLFLVQQLLPTTDTVDITDALSSFLRLQFTDTPHQSLPWVLATSYPDTRSRIALGNMLDQQAPSPGVRDVNGVPQPVGAGSGHVKATWDTDINPNNSPPSFPNADAPMGLSRDLGNIRPEALLTAKVTLTYNGSDPMTLFESLAGEEQPVMEDVPLVFGQQWIPTVPAAGMQLREPQSPGGTLSVDYMQVTLCGTPPSPAVQYLIKIYVDEVLVATETVSHSAPWQVYEFGPSPAPQPLASPFSVLSSEQVKVVLEPALGVAQRYVLKGITVVLGTGVSWDPMGPSLPAGDYSVVRTL